MTPKQQYKLLRKGDHANMENIPSMIMAMKITTMIPHFMVKSVLMKMASSDRPSTIEKVMTAAVITT